MFNKENFVSATFADRDLRYVEVLYNHNKEIHTFVVDLLDTKNPDTQRLLDIHDFESIESLTVQTKKEERESFESLVLELAKRDGLLPQEQKEQKEQEDPKISLEDLIFNWDEKNEEQKESLFQLKLKIFDMKKIQKSKNKSVKTSLRKAQTPLGALVAYSKF